MLLIKQHSLSFIHPRIYIAPLQGNYSEVLPIPARSKRTVLQLIAMCLKVSLRIGLYTVRPSLMTNLKYINNDIFKALADPELPNRGGGQILAEIFERPFFRRSEKNFCIFPRKLSSISQNF